MEQRAASSQTSFARIRPYGTPTYPVNHPPTDQPSQNPHLQVDKSKSNTPSHSIPFLSLLASRAAPNTSPLACADLKTYRPYRLTVQTYRTVALKTSLCRADLTDLPYRTVYLKTSLVATSLLIARNCHCQKSTARKARKARKASASAETVELGGVEEGGRGGGMMCWV